MTSPQTKVLVKYQSSTHSETSNPETNQALGRLRSRHSWFNPKLFRSEAYKYTVSPKVSRDICKWLEPECTNPIFVLLESFNSAATLSKVTSCLCAANEPSKWILVPCFALRAPGKPTAPSRDDMFLELLISIVAGLLPVNQTQSKLAKDALEMELLCKQNTPVARGLALKLISDLLAQLSGRCLILVDEFFKFDNTSSGQAEEHWTQLLSLFARYNNPPDRLVRTFIRTSRSSNVLKFNGTSGCVVMAGSHSSGTVVLKNSIQDKFAD